MKRVSVDAKMDCLSREDGQMLPAVPSLGAVTAAYVKALTELVMALVFLYR